MTRVPLKGMMKRFGNVGSGTRVWLKTAGFRGVLWEVINLLEYLSW